MSHDWADYVALALSMVVIGGTFAVLVTDHVERRRAGRPPSTLGKTKPPASER